MTYSLSEKPLRFPTPETFNLKASDIDDYLSTKQLNFRHKKSNMLGIVQEKPT